MYGILTMCLALYETFEKHYLKKYAQQSFEQDTIIIFI